MLYGFSAKKSGILQLKHGHIYLPDVVPAVWNAEASHDLCHFGLHLCSVHMNQQRRQFIVLLNRAGSAALIGINKALDRLQLPAFVFCLGCWVIYMWILFFRLNLFPAYHICLPKRKWADLVLPPMVQYRQEYLSHWSMLLTCVPWWFISSPSANKILLSESSCKKRCKRFLGVGVLVYCNGHLVSKEAHQVGSFRQATVSKPQSTICNMEISTATYLAGKD